jgi:hypothetical protein
MSRSVKSSPSSCCKACKDFGKSKSEYESHNTRDARGRLVCPTIRSNVCSKCSKIGHLPSRCTVKVDENFEKMFMRMTAAPVKPELPKATIVASGGRFADLLDTSSEDDSPRVSSPRKNATQKIAPHAPVKAANAESTGLASPVKLFSASRRDWADYDSDEEFF